MEINHFKGLTTADEAKIRYRRLAKTMHPDGGGSDAAMAELTRQYEAFQPAKERMQDAFEDAFTRARERQTYYYQHPHTNAFNSQQRARTGFGYINDDDPATEMLKTRIRQLEATVQSFEEGHSALDKARRCAQTNEFKAQEAVRHLSHEKRALNARIKKLERMLNNSISKDLTLWQFIKMKLRIVNDVE